MSTSLTKIGRYELQGELGRGAMGIVYRGYDPTLGRQLAVKTVFAHLADEEFLKRLKVEARAAARLTHPNIITVFDAGEEAGNFYIAMELVEGQTLQQMLAAGPMPVAQAALIVQQVGSALDHAHQNGIIHRDVKPANIMVANGVAKVMDFGVAKLGASGSTSTGQLLGTPAYMSPELVKGMKIDGRSDIFSLGVMLYEMLTGVKPFPGESITAVIYKIVEQPVPPPRNYNPNLDPAFSEIFSKVLAKNPEERYQSCAELVRDLRDLVPGLAESPGGVIGAQPGTVMLNRSDVPPPVTGANASGINLPAAAAAAPANTSGVVASGLVNSSAIVSASGVHSQTTKSGRYRVSLTESQRRKRLLIWNSLRLTRWTISLLMWAYTAACVITFAMPLFRQKALTVLAPALMRIQAFVEPLATTLTSLVKIHFVYQDFNLVYALLAAIVFFVRVLIVGRFLDIEDRVYKPIASAAEANAREATAMAVARATGSAREATRVSLLREYAEARRVLGQAKRTMAFLSMDVVGSTKMKVGEDKLVIEHAFTEYKKYLERIFNQCHSYKVAWTPDGVMVAFHTVDNATKAARSALHDLDHFNTLHQLRGKFHIRCGVNFGEVMIPDTKPLEEVSDHVIDVAGHLQKYADPDTIWISDFAFTTLQEKSGFEPSTEKVDGHSVLVVTKAAIQKIEAEKKAQKAPQQ